MEVRDPLPRFAAGPVAAVAGVCVVLLAATAGRYGYHRDELYFRILGRHLSWGYVDEPPLTPLLGRVSTAVFGDNLVAFRIPAILCAAAAAAVVVVALIVRELGGGRAAQVLATAGLATTGAVLLGHTLATATVDVVFWLLTILFAGRALLRGRPRWWLAVGVTAGLGSYNKQLVALLLVALVAGLLIAGPRRELREPWLWAGLAIALLLAAPNIVYQITHGWPQLEMARAIARNKGHDDRVTFVPLQLALVGPSAIWIIGLVRVLRDEAWRPVRALAWAYLVACVLTLVSGGQPYYPVGLLIFLFAAGSVVVARWAGRRRARWAWPVAAVVLSAAATLVVALPLIPVTSVGSTGVPAASSVVGDQIGWPVYVREVAEIVAGLPAAERAHAVLLTANYGEAGALDKYGPRYHLPAVYSGHNELYNYGPPPDSATVAVVVGLDQPFLEGAFATCETMRELDNRVGVENEEQGDVTVRVCRGPREPWPALWRRFQHYD
ncbi:glycosyltransferase family 39 protein [Actinoplanes sp. KI2]|uniref:glycosyltransferase family 39 protein n=1 Tax=Actinoplanes sp. KI2 TaxID=2983315 RepID=UPI0021D5AF39|nr:glycosyltransferase family 39 protein [Actinoplanes sp. KI2]MCU7730214.1 glycosyltransferase family 39 protein [Actinoplanes sp. KI2]